MKLSALTFQQKWLYTNKIFNLFKLLFSAFGRLLRCIFFIYYLYSADSSSYDAVLKGYYLQLFILLYLNYSLIS